MKFCLFHVISSLDEDVERVKASPDSLLKYAPDRALDEDRRQQWLNL